MLKHPIAKLLSADLPWYQPSLNVLILTLPAWVNATSHRKGNSSAEAVTRLSKRRCNNTEKSPTPTSGQLEMDQLAHYVGAHQARQDLSRYRCQCLYPNIQETFWGKDPLLWPTNWYSFEGPQKWLPFSSRRFQRKSWARPRYLAKCHRPSWSYIGKRSGSYAARTLHPLWKKNGPPNVACDMDHDNDDDWNYAFQLMLTCSFQFWKPFCQILESTIIHCNPCRTYNMLF